MSELSTQNGGVPSEVLERLHELERANDQLRTALEHRVVLEQAKGAISARCEVDPDTAFEMVCGLARSQGRDLHEFAAEIVANGGRLDA